MASWSRLADIGANGPPRREAASRLAQIGFDPDNSMGALVASMPDIGIPAGARLPYGVEDRRKPWDYLPYAGGYVKTPADQVFADQRTGLSWSPMQKLNARTGALEALIQEIQGGNQPAIPLGLSTAPQDVALSRFVSRALGSKDPDAERPYFTLGSAGQ